MGWAPIVLFTGLFLSLFETVQFVWTSTSYPLLLDNEPLSGPWIWWKIFLFTGGLLITTIFALLHTSGRTSIHRTASRSQVRAQGHRGCYNRSLALCFVLVLVAFYNLDPVRGEGSVMGMRDVRAGDEAPAKKHVVEP